MGKIRRVGPVFGWYDNFDLQVSTANRRRETRVRAHEFQVNSAGIILIGRAEVGVMNLLTHSPAQSSCTVSYHHPSYYCSTILYQRKVNPPVVSVTSGVTHLCARG